MLVNLICWNTVDAPGPEFNKHYSFEHLPRVGDQIEVEENQVMGLEAAIYYVHKIRHIFKTGGFKTVVEITTRHPGMAS